MKILFLPLIILGKLAGFIIRLTGRLLGIILGCALIMVGVFTTMTIIGGFIGVPLVILGIILIIKSLS
ncbi:MAG TPA: hypothetical protein GXX70_06750 [Tepidimicrobium sp.]|nr:hypothetical protein [Tepidimicrobium sp.]